MKRAAIFSQCRNYRYTLCRIWDESKTIVMCVGLNPSTANAESDDPTIRSLIRILTNLGFGGLQMVNLFALISPDPTALRTCPDPVKDNDKYIINISNQCEVIVFCWGNFKQAEYRATKLKQWFPSAMCFGKNSSGTPKHPLYLKGNSSLIRFVSQNINC